MAKLGRWGTRFEETLQRAGTLPLEPPPDPVPGILHNEGSKWWLFSPGTNGLHPAHGWMPIDPTDEQRSEYRLQVTVRQAEDMDKIADALKRGMKGEFQKGIDGLENPPQESTNANDWYETGKGWNSNTLTAHHPCELQVLPSMKDRRYYLVAESLPKYAGEDTLFVQGYLDEEELEKRAESVQVYGQWMRTVGYELARYTWYQLAEGHKREFARAAYDALAERGIVVTRHDWMDNPDLTNEVARAIASINKES